MPFAQYILLLYVFFRNQAYQTRTQLSILDYNSHFSRDQAKMKGGIQIYNKKFWKQTKNGTYATPVLEQKKYPHIPSLMKAIEKHHQPRDTVLRNTIQSPYDQTSAIQGTPSQKLPVK